MANIPLTVPEVVAASFIVGLPVRVADPTAVVTAHLRAATDDGSLLAAEVTLACVERGLVACSEVALDEIPPLELLELFGAAPDEVDGLRRAAQLVVVTSQFLPTPSAQQELLARTAVRALGRAVPSTIVVDAAIPRIVPIEELVDEEGEVPLRTSRLVLVPVSAGERGHWLTTKGMSRWGLPELQANDVPPSDASVWVSVLSGLALALIVGYHRAIEADEAERPAMVEIPELLTVSARTVARAYGHDADDDDPDLDGEATVRLRFDPASDIGADDFLTVCPPDDFARSAGEFFAEVPEALFGRSEGEMGYIEAGDPGMDQAVATARGCLDVARARFLAGDFQHRQLLMVKWLLETPDGGSEFPWFFVTDWSDPDHLAGTAAVDAHVDPSIRVGRPVRVAASSIADWGVFVDGKGIVEGGWTNAYLQGDPAPPIPTAGGDGGRRRWGRRKG